jgi:hypothetical protein
VIRWQIVSLSHGIATGLYQPIDALGTDPTALAAVSERASDSLDMCVWQPRSDEWLGEDRTPYPHAAVELAHPNMQCANVTIWEQSRLSDARVLVIEAVKSRRASTAGRGSEEAGSSDPPTASTPEIPEAPALNPEGPIVILPMKGGVGAMADETGGFFTAADLNRALSEAYRLRPSAIVLEINSGGGRLDTKEAIVQTLLTGAAGGQRFVAAIRDAGSAAALIALACKEIVSFPGARMGAAVTIQMGEEGVVSLKKLLEDDPELEKKLSSFRDANDTEAALALGRSPAISAAMKKSDAELWWSPTSGFSDKQAAEDSELLDGPQSVLTLTHTRMVNTGLAKQLVAINGIGELLGLGADRQVVRLDAPMQATFKRLRELATELESANPGHMEQLRDEAINLLTMP